MHKGIFLKLIDFCLYRNVENKSRMLPEHEAQSRVFYDGSCPICRFEMQHLKRLDRGNRLEQIDISAANFVADAWSANLDDLNRALHVMTPSNEWLVGMPAVRHVYREVGMGWLIVVTELPVLAAMLDAGYLRFASNRMKISRWSGIDGVRPAVCSDDVCGLNANTERRRA